MQSQIPNPLSVLKCHLSCVWSFINTYCDKLLTYKPAFLKFLSQLIMKIYRAGRMWFYRFLHAVVVQAHISLMTRLHINEKIAKANKGIGIICKLAHILPREFLITVKSFVRPHIDYGVIIYDQPNNDSFCNIAK